MPHEIKRTSDSTSLDKTETKMKSSGINDYMRHVYELADRDIRSASSSPQDRGKRQLSASELAEQEWRKVEPGEDGRPPEKVVIPDRGLRAGMHRGDAEASSSSAVTSERLYPKLIDIDNRFKLLEEIDKKLKDPSLDDDEYDSLTVQRDRLSKELGGSGGNYHKIVDGQLFNHEELEYMQRHWNREHSKLRQFAGHLEKLSIGGIVGAFEKRLREEQQRETQAFMDWGNVRRETASERREREIHEEFKREQERLEKERDRAARRYWEMQAKGIDIAK